MDRSGGGATQTLKLKHGGDVLVIHTHIEFPDDSSPARDVKRVYRKVTDS